MNNIDSNLFREAPRELSKTQTTILIALSVIMAVGMVLSYFLGAPWLVPLAFFALALVPLFPIWKARNPKSNRIEN